MKKGKGSRRGVEGGRRVRERGTEEGKENRGPFSNFFTDFPPPTGQSLAIHTLANLAGALEPAAMMSNGAVESGVPGGRGSKKPRFPLSLCLAQRESRRWTPLSPPLLSLHLRLQLSLAEIQVYSMY